MAARPGTYQWEVPGRPITIFLSLDIIDRMLQDVMRGFGAVPKRGAEVGGILLGKVVDGPKLRVDIEDYEVVPIEYRRGPSFMLAEGDAKAFEETVTRLRKGAASGLLPVGMFRSHTRDSTGLGPEDLELADRYFPEPDKVFLLIRPFATRVSTAGFYFRESNNRFQDGPPLGEFPFRRKDLEGNLGVATEAATEKPREPRRRVRRQPSNSDLESLGASRAIALAPHRSGPAEEEHEEAPPREFPIPEPFEHELRKETETALSGKRKTRIWLPLSFVFLLVGILLGFETAVTLRPPTGGSTEPFQLGLTVTKDADDLNVRWDRESAPVKASRHGLLEIQDGRFTKTVDLDPGQLQTGSVIYRRSTGNVKFRLEVQVRDHTFVIENLEWTE